MWSRGIAQATSTATSPGGPGNRADTGTKGVQPAMLYSSVRSTPEAYGDGLLGRLTIPGFSGESSRASCYYGRRVSRNRPDHDSLTVMRGTLSTRVLRETGAPGAELPLPVFGVGL